jgi:phthiodiolone/phenolphthiodiolone dimycocerosates ketoreductase
MMKGRYVSAKPVKFGLFGNEFPPMDAALESFKRAEAQGWKFLDLPDQIMSTHPQGMLAPPVPAADLSAPTSFYSDVWFGSMEMCAAAAVLTEEIEILLAVIDPLRRSPAVMAQEMMTLQHMSKGRMTFAIGAGEEKQFKPFGEVRTKPFARLEEAAAIWKTLWESDGRPVSRESEFWPLTDAIFPIPMWKSGPPELLFVGGGPRIQRLAGTVGNGWLTFLPGGAGNDYVWLADYIRGMMEFAEKAGNDPDALRFNAQVITVLAEDDKTAWELARHANPGWIAITCASIDSSKTWEKWGFKNPLGDFNWAQDINPMLSTTDRVVEMVTQIPDQVTDFALVWGGAERVAGRIQEMIDAGINEISFFNMAASAQPEYGAHWADQISQVIKLLGGEPLKS